MHVLRNISKRQPYADVDHVLHSMYSVLCFPCLLHTPMHNIVQRTINEKNEAPLLA